MSTLLVVVHTISADDENGPGLIMSVCLPDNALPFLQTILISPINSLQYLNYTPLLPPTNFIPSLIASVNFPSTKSLTPFCSGLGMKPNSIK
jgi:hypothetical protein